MRLGVFNGSIPAWAGQPANSANWERKDRVYPRVGGATWRWAKVSRSSSGLSPRGRGNPTVSSLQSSAAGSIPAWAGQPLPGALFHLIEKVYPRVGGATSTSLSSHSPWLGLSPRGRGNRAAVVSPCPWCRSIPAWAGQPINSAWAKFGDPVYPRVGGATAASSLVASARFGLSPRGRGNQVRYGHWLSTLRSIPAWAGQPITIAAPQFLQSVYPRVGGATPRMGWWGDSDRGLSPRGRGNRSSGHSWRIGGRSIPAWAGQPKPSGGVQSAPSVYPRVGGATMSKLVARQ